MNTSTANLENDHVYILRLIDVMEVVSGLSSPDITDLKAIVNLIRNYADGSHHAKEENLLFPLLAERGFSLQNGPVAVMLHEHTLGRDYVKGMVQGIEKYQLGDKGAISAISENMKGYISLLRNHIAKENNILFRMADKVLNEADHNDLLMKFKEVETIKGPASGYISEIEKLEKRYKK
jgi:hemerythrin-like domain-containing protein